jgi:uncharacterized protein (TIRG00374 family)
MKSKIINILKIVLPLGFGVFLIWLFYDALCEDQKKDLFAAFGKANYFWVFLALGFSFLSHLSRAYRWKYLLKPMGFRIKFWNAYHALMIGYIVNIVFPRAGEASRAGVLSKSEKVPFQKGFGTILAERTVDVAMLGIVSLIALGLQYDKIDLFQHKINTFNEGMSQCGNGAIFDILGAVVKYLIIGGFVAVVVMFVLKKTFRKRVIDFIKGLFEGIFSIFKTDQKLPFIGHTFFVWIMYIANFSACLYALDSTAGLGWDAILAGFVAGTLGMIMVQGGIGVYPAFVGLILTIYLADENYSGILPDALAIGWINWTSQTLMMIILGLISLALNGKNVKFAKDELVEPNT